MSHALKSIIKRSAHRLGQHLEAHQRNPTVTLADHIRLARRKKRAQIGSKKLIYLDTNAWKCMADYRQNKPSLTPAMIMFAESLERASKTGAFAFPIGAPTFLELDSITMPSTRSILNQLVDELSEGLCIIPSPDRIGTELRQLRTGNTTTEDDLEEYLCSPIELFGIPAISLPAFVKAHVDEVTFNKAFFDTLAEQPLSIQLEVVKDSPGGKWNNSQGIDDLNSNKEKYQDEIANLNVGIFVELKGCISSWFDHERIELQPKEIAIYAAMAMNHWHETPHTRAFPYLRVLSSLHGLLRFDRHRRYRSGDPNDFMIAASALPIAHAFFTDRRLAALLSDPSINLSGFSSCAVISGFEEMAAYLNSYSGELSL